MSVFFQMVNTFVTLRKLVRMCPRCRHKQIVPSSELKRAVRCKHCGVSIPPGHVKD